MIKIKRIAIRKIQGIIREIQTWWRLYNGRCTKCNTRNGIKGCRACSGIGISWFKH